MATVATPGSLADRAVRDPDVASADLGRYLVKLTLIDRDKNRNLVAIDDAIQRAVTTLDLYAVTIEDLAASACPPFAEWWSATDSFAALGQAAKALLGIAPKQAFVVVASNWSATLYTVPLGDSVNVRRST